MSQQQRRSSHTTPDYGTAYVPNAGPSHLAPKSLDHFKRGYEERAAQRDKEYYSRRHGPTGRENRPDRGGDIDRKQRPTIVQGLNIDKAIDRLVPLIHSRNAIFHELDSVRKEYPNAIDNGKGITLMISTAARHKQIGVGNAIWDWMDAVNIQKNTFHYNSMISVMEKARDYRRALALLQEMKDKNIDKNEVTFSSAISACEKSGKWETALELLETMEKENIKRTAIVYNAAISACEKGMVPQRACDVFRRMKAEGIRPTVVSYSALISAAEKGGQWRLALEILEEMKQAGFQGNVVAYSAAISALAKGQQWRQALDLFRDIQSRGGTPSIVTYNATMTALEKGMQWELALDLFEEMKMRNLPITVVSYGSAISACDKGFQYRQCLEFLDEMTDMGIQKNVIIFGAAMSCMEKCSRADIGFELLRRMRLDGIEPNVHIYNSLISACSRSALWEKGYELFEEMGRLGVKRDVVTYNAVLDAVSSQIKLGRKLFQEGVEKGFYAKVSRLGERWLELDLHFLSLGGGEIALGWWFEVCLVPYLSNVSKLEDIKTISIVTGYGKTRTRGRRHGDDGMRKRVKTMLKYMNIKEEDQTNAGRIHIDKNQLIAEVNKNGGKVIFDLAGYTAWKETETTANVVPDVEQKIRARFKPKREGSSGPPFLRIENDSTSEEYRLGNTNRRALLAEDVKGPDYRADIDYAARDGIRFAVGGRRAEAGSDESNDRKPESAPGNPSQNTTNPHPEQNRNQSTHGRRESSQKQAGNYDAPRTTKDEQGDHFDNSRGPQRSYRRDHNDSNRTYKENRGDKYNGYQEKRSEERQVSQQYEEPARHDSHRSNHRYDRNHFEHLRDDRKHSEYQNSSRHGNYNNGYQAHERYPAREGYQAHEGHQAHKGHHAHERYQAPRAGCGDDRGHRKYQNGRHNSYGPNSEANNYYGRQGGEIHGGSQHSSHHHDQEFSQSRGKTDRKRSADDAERRMSNSSRGYPVEQGQRRRLS